ncbi:MAG: AMP phosphorylase [Candidatus Undinarchaeales archaeon]
MLKIKTFDIDFGGAEVVLNIEDANDLELRTQDRVKIVSKEDNVVAIINTTSTFVKPGEIGIFKKVMSELGVKSGEKVKLEPVEKPESVEYIKKKLDGYKLSKEEIYSIVNDTVNESLSLIDLAAFVSALHARGMEMDEVVNLTEAMTKTGETIKFSGATYDKHSLGGVPGDKTTLLVVPIVAAAGLIIPKTSSRAITDPAGTADRMEVFSPVSHDIEDIEKIVKKTNGCIVWGGAVDLAPADDSLIQVEYPLSLDPRPLLLASVMSKKNAVNSKFVVIDIPMGAGSKVSDYEEARKLAHDFVTLGDRLGMKVECALTYGAQPVGDSMGPALEAREALKALQGDGPNSLLEKSTAIAGILLEAGGIAERDEGEKVAMEYLENGKALKKFRQIIKAQGGNPDITVEDIEKKIGKHKETIKAPKQGYVTKIQNRKIASVAKSAGAPHDKGAGIVLHAKGGAPVEKGKPLFTIYAEKKYKLETAVKLARKLNPVIIEGMLLEEIPEHAFLGRH